jgi:phage terminase large subunit GpA-like protein
MSEAVSLAVKCLELLRPPPDINVWQWAEEHRRLGKDVTAIPGRYHVTSAPYQSEPQESFTDKDVQTTVLLWASRLGKTELLNNLEGYTIHHNPRGILVVYPTLDSAKKWSKEFFVPMLKSTPCLRGKIRDSRSRDANNTILSKQFPGGKISAIGANSPSGFRQIQAPVVICDEIDAMDNGAEGDPIALAFRRADNYRDSIQVLSSTPTVKGLSRIEQWFEKTDKREWFVPCLACETYQVLKWEQVIWPDKSTNEARVKCGKCGVLHDDTARREMVMRGQWRSTAPFTGIRGYRLNGLASLFPAKKGFASRLHQMVSEYLDAKAGGEFTMQAWTNTFLAESYEPPAEKVDAAPLMQRAEEYGGEDENNPVLPRYVLALTAAVDVQKDRLEVEVVGWGVKEECWGIEFRRLIGDPGREEVWRQLDTILEREYRHECGGTLKVERCGIDAGFSGPDVHRFVKPRQPRVLALVGRLTPGAMMFTITPKPNKHGTRLYIVGVDTIKDLVFARLKLDAPGPRYFHWPRGFGFDPSYFEQLTSEQSKTIYQRGFPKRVWILPSGKRNEALDVRVYNLAAWAVHQYHKRPNLERLAAEMEKRGRESAESVPAAAPVKQPTQPKASPIKAVVMPPPARTTARQPRPPRGNFATSWKR